MHSTSSLRLSTL